MKMFNDNYGELRVNIYVKCPYSKKDECKNSGGRWDAEKKLWYFRVCEDSIIEEKYSSRGFQVDSIGVGFESHSFLSDDIMNLLNKILGGKDELKKIENNIFSKVHELDQQRKKTNNESIDPNLIHLDETELEKASIYCDELDRAMTNFDCIIRNKLREHIMKTVLNNNKNRNRKLNKL